MPKQSWDLEMLNPVISFHSDSKYINTCNIWDIYVIKGKSISRVIIRGMLLIIEETRQTQVICGLQRLQKYVKKIKI